MNKDFFTATLMAKPELLQAMLAFNGLLVSPPLPEELAGFPHAETLWQQAEVRRRFGVCGTAEPDFWDFDDEVFRLVFLDANTIKRLALVFGVAAIAPELCHLLRRDEVCAARERLGDALYAYALHRARFQVNADVIPAGLAVPEDSPVDMRAYAVGVGSLLTLTSRWPELLRSRFLLPDAAQTPPSLPVSTDDPGADHQNRLWSAVKKVLLKEVAPSWAPCFD